MSTADLLDRIVVDDDNVDIISVGEQGPPGAAMHAYDGPISAVGLAASAGVSVQAARGDHVHEAAASAVSYANAELPGVETVEAAIDALLGGIGLTDNYVTIGTAQSITGAKTFEQPLTVTEPDSGASIFAYVSDGYSEVYGSPAGTSAFGFFDVWADSTPVYGVAGLTLNRAGAQFDLRQWSASAAVLTTTHGFSVEPQTSSVVPLRMRGAVGQAANLTEWRSSALALLAYVDAAGNGSFGGASTVGGSQVVTAGNIGTYAPAPDLSPYVTLGTAQTITGAKRFDAAVNFGADAAISRVAADTLLLSGTVRTNNLAMTAMSSHGMFAEWSGSAWEWVWKAGTSAHRPMMVRGAASQTADLHQWQSSAAAVLARVTAVGKVRSVQDVVAWDGDGKQVLIGANIAGSAAGVTFGVDSSTQIYRDAASQLTVWGSGAGGTRLTISGGSYPSLVLGTTSFSNYSGSGSLGQMTTTAYDYAQGSNISAHRFTIGAAAGTFIVRGAAAQTGNLTEWQTSAGGVVTKIGSDGALTIAPTATLDLQTWTYPTFARSLILRAQGANEMWFHGSSLSSVGFSNSLSTVKFQASINGQSAATITGFRGPSDITDNAATGRPALYLLQNGMGYPALKIGNSSMTTGEMPGAWNSDGSIAIALAQASAVGITVKSAVSQTADVQQWQNSAATVLAKINSAGQLVLAATTVGGDVNGLLYGPNKISANFWGSSTDIGLVGTGGTAGISFGGDTTLYRAAAGEAVHRTTVTNGTARLVVRGDGTGWATLEAQRGSDGYVGARVNQTEIRTLGVVIAAGDGASTQLQSNWLGNAFTGLDFSADNHSVRIAKSGYSAGASAASVRLLVDAVASQTADLQQWRSSAAAILGRVTAAGELQMGVAGQPLAHSIAGRTFNLTLESGYGMSLTSGNLIVYPAHAAVVGITSDTYSYGAVGTRGMKIRMKDATTADAFQLTLGVADTLLFRLEGLTGAVLAPTAATPALKVKGVASQTANLQEWQDSASAVRTFVSSDGSFQMGNNAQSWSPTMNLQGRGVLALLSALHGSLQNGVALVLGDHVSYPFSHRIYGASNAPTNPKTEVLRVEASRAVETPLVLRSFAAQTADSLRVEKSDGTRQWGFREINPAGVIVATTAIEGYLWAGSTNPTFQVIAYNSEAANFTTGSYWDGITYRNGGVNGGGQMTLNASGLTVSTVAPGTDGAVASSITRFVADGSSRLANGAIDTTAQLRITSSSASRAVARFRAAASQTASLTEWQNSAGTNLLAVLAAGDLDFLATGRGPVLVAPDATRYRLTVANGGALVTTAI